jgi:hypothetical protein
MIIRQFLKSYCIHFAIENIRTTKVFGLIHALLPIRVAGSSGKFFENFIFYSISLK